MGSATVATCDGRV